MTIADVLAGFSSILSNILFFMIDQRFICAAVSVLSLIFLAWLNFSNNCRSKQYYRTYNNLYQGTLTLFRIFFLYLVL